jgi:hypothetical protein
VILVVICGISLGVVALTVAIDAWTAYRAELPPKDPKPTKKVSAVEDKEVKKGITAYRNLKRIEFGLHMVSKREVRVDRPRGAHRRLQVS